MKCSHCGQVGEIHAAATVDIGETVCQLCALSLTDGAGNHPFRAGITDNLPGSRVCMFCESAPGDFRTVDHYPVCRGCAADLDPELLAPVAGCCEQCATEDGDNDIPATRYGVDMVQGLTWRLCDLHFSQSASATVCGACGQGDCTCEDLAGR